MNIRENISLEKYTTFMTSAQARFFVEIFSAAEMQSLIKKDVWNNNPYILGGGSNILFTGDYDGLIVVNSIKGKDITNETEKYVDIRFGSGESWHESVMWSVEKNLWGIENLALVPGTIGAAPVQNIGAYGTEAADTIHSVEVININSGDREILNNAQCNFGYRDSIFKQFPGKYFITAVIFRLSKIPNPQLGYGAIIDKLDQNNITNPDIEDIAQTIIEIRRSKLPDVGSIGMAGSFFKNPVINKLHLLKLQKKYPAMPYYELANEMVKIPAGWIIETLGYKGFRDGNVGTYNKHALVLVNYGGADGAEVWNFAKKIINETQQIFNIILEPEVIIK